MKRTEGSRAVDALLEFIAIGSVTALSLVAPNAWVAFDKPLSKFLKKMDERERRREIQRLLRYVKNKNLVSWDYEHGLKLTNKAKERLKNLDYINLEIKPLEKWDGKWRIVFFDVPEQKKHSRDGFSAKLKKIGMIPIQRSVFVHPDPCRDEVLLAADHFSIRRFVSYIETTHLENDKALKLRFNLK
jgi:DNA-binding transcriptional regulator PaaX